MAIARAICISLVICEFIAPLSYAVTCSYTPEYRNCDCSKMGGVTSEEMDLMQVYCVNQKNLTTIPDTLPTTLGRFYATLAKIHRLSLGSLVKFPKLKELHLLRCELEHIANGTFTKQQNLQELLLGENRVGVLFTETFTGLKFLRRFVLSRNRVAKLTRGVFVHLQSLVYLDIADNAISVIEDGAFEGMHFLKTIILSGHKVHKFGPQTFGSLPSLFKLDASFGQNLREIHDRTFIGTPDLKLLHLNDNSLRYLPVRSYRVIARLEELDLSTNNIRFVPSDAFEGMSSLQTLFLNSANLSFIQNGSINGLVALKTLHLYDNPLFCDCNLRWLREWLNSNGKFEFKLESPSRIKCSYPTLLNGSVLLQQNASDFKCSCETCRGNHRCLGPTNSTCNCSNGTLTDSCDLSCKSFQSPSREQCISADDQCYCNKQSELPVCHRNATLGISEDGKYSCVCKEGYQGDGLYCTDINECLSVQIRCYGNTTDCINAEGSFICVCKPGYTAQTGDVTNCKPISITITVLVINSTTVKILWEPRTNKASYELLYKEIGEKGAKIIWLQTGKIDAALGIYILGGLKSNAVYELNLVLLTGNPDDEIDLGSKTFRTNLVVNAESKSTDVLSPSSVTAIALACVLLATIVVFVACFVYRRRKHRQHQDSSLTLSHPFEEAGSHTVRYVPDIRPLTATNEVISTEPLDEWEIPRGWLLIGEQLGEGEFGLVLEGTLRNDKGEVKVAVKTLKDDATRFDYKDMLAELKVFKKVGYHPNVVSLIGACTSPGGPLYIVTEFVGGGNLLDYLRASRRGQKPEYVNMDPPVSEKDLLQISLHVARGMKHISQNALVHRDLAARNILLMEDGAAKVSDFGLSRSLYSDGVYVKKTGGRLPLKWMAPESIEQFEFTSKSDVWSYGVLLWEMATFGGFPYPEISANLLLDKLCSGHRLQKPVHCSDGLYGVMSSCWSVDPDLRPTFEDLCGILEDMLSRAASVYVNLDMAGMFQYVEYEPGNNLSS